MQIVKILKVVDTRSREEINDRFIPIPGSGDSNECFRCGKLHEIHAHVQLENGQQVIIGTGCMDKDNTEMAKRFKSMERAAKRLAALKAEKAAHEAKCAKFEAARMEVESMAVPPLTEEKGFFTVGFQQGQSFLRLVCGDANIPCFSGRTEEREQCVVWVWKSNRIAERCGMTHQPFAAKQFAREIAKLEKALSPQE